MKLISIHTLYCCLLFCLCNHAYVYVQMETYVKFFGRCATSSQFSQNKNQKHASTEGNEKENKNKKHASTEGKQKQKPKLAMNTWEPKRDNVTQ